MLVVYEAKKDTSDVADIRIIRKINERLLPARAAVLCAFDNQLIVVKGKAGCIGGPLIEKCLLCTS
ncbi:MAG: hypothetical protein K2G51_02985, partial [Lachnospiraceae bacterium]|nr:hypothetical protein [Lachnospiraceae bacterium]